MVARGSVIGTLQRGSSHCFPRACLHWGLLRGDTYLDPLTLVGAGPVRLLPLSGACPGGPGLRVSHASRSPVRAAPVSGRTPRC